MREKNALRQTEALQKAEGLAYQILQHQKAPRRNLASIINDDFEMTEQGHIGLDPWGQPFRFRIMNEFGTVPQIVVWSFGPNGKFDSSEEEFVSIQDVSGSFSQGDDLGFILPIQ